MHADQETASSALPPDHFRRPSPARLWNYLQGGKDNYQIDRDAAEAMTAAYPDMPYAARQVRRFHNRAVRYVAEVGAVRQFLDIGCGLPAPAGSTNTHEIVHAVDPAARTVYCDNDKAVLAHAEALLTSSIPGAGPTAYVDADIRDIDHLLGSAGDTLDFAQPVAVLCFGVLGYVVDLDETHSILTRLINAVPTGGYLLLEDGVDSDPGMPDACDAEWQTHGGQRYIARAPDVFARYFHRLELVAPGVVPVTLWRPNQFEDGSPPRPVAEYGGVGVKP